MIDRGAWLMMYGGMVQFLDWTEYFHAYRGYIPYYGLYSGAGAIIIMGLLYGAVSWLIKRVK